MSNDVTKLIEMIGAGDEHATNELLPLIYSELRRLAQNKLASEKPGHSLQATALVHEAYLRLVSAEKGQNWNGRRHFFGAASEAMRRILVEQARKKRNLKSGREFNRVDISIVEPETSDKYVDLILLDETLEQLGQHDTRAFEVVRLRFFAGLTVNEVADLLNVSVSTVENDWTYAKSWLKRVLRDK